MIRTSIIHEPIWAKLEPYLHLVEHGDQVRIDFLDVPEHLAHQLVMITMPCVNCRRPNHPLRRREGDEWTRLFYAPTCPLRVRMGCSRSRAAWLEYQRFLGLKREAAQLALL